MKLKEKRDEWVESMTRPFKIMTAILMLCVLMLGCATVAIFSRGSSNAH